MEFYKAEAGDLRRVCSFYQKVSENMVAEGLDQWVWGRYPNEQILQESISKGELYLVWEFGQHVACVVVTKEQDPEYQSVNWEFGLKPGLIHKLAVHPKYRGQGVAGRILDKAELMLREMGCDCLRCDTRSDNQKALSLYNHHALRISGRIHWDDDPESVYYALEKPLIRECAMLPIRMHPAFRSGKLTPWGGDRLKTRYGKDLKEIPTGESLEVSCIPGLESTDDMGRSLPELIRDLGPRFSGKYSYETFPLLLKLLDAKEALSVQVHPGDAYAAANENGKLGKTEAWLILDAQEDSELIYGIVPGTDLDTLKAASEAGSKVSPLLRRVKVRPGDVCYIPAGCVHAIGAGIMLYEIQQSSDVTYRFYDWDRVDQQGKKRELHLEKALAVTDLEFSAEPLHSPEGTTARVLDKTYFTLDLLSVKERQALPSICNFGLLTAIEGDLTLRWHNAGIHLKPGETFFLPACSPLLTLCGDGKAAVSMPTEGDA